MKVVFTDELMVHGWDKLVMDILQKRANENGKAFTDKPVKK